MSNSNSKFFESAIAIIVVILVLAGIGGIVSMSEPKCHRFGCDNRVSEDYDYCFIHDSYHASNDTSWMDSYISSADSDYSSGNSYESTNSVKTSTSSNMSTSTSVKSNYKSPHASYDEGYDDVYLNEDYDWDRYWSDSDYADGVDDALEDMDW